MNSVIDKAKRLIMNPVNFSRFIASRFQNLFYIFNKKRIVSTHKYKNYQEYVEHQKSKTMQPERINKWLNEEWAVKLNGFKNIFERNADYIQGKQNALCLGARTGQEVKALRDIGISAIGIDLVPFEPYTIEGDIHNLQFREGEFDLVFTNIFDHSLYPEKFCSEMERVTQSGGVIMIHLQLGSDVDRYTETIVLKPNAVLEMFHNVEKLQSRRIKNTFDSMDWELILMKK